MEIAGSDRTINIFQETAAPCITEVDMMEQWCESIGKEMLGVFLRLIKSSSRAHLHCSRHKNLWDLSLERPSS